MRLVDELRVTSFDSSTRKAILNILVTADRVSFKINAALKPVGLSKEQFNVLRILRGQHPNPCPLQTISERMVSKSSNASRLVDKLLKRGLVARGVCDTNRRKVDILITAEGLDVLERADAAMQSYAFEYGELQEEEADQLNRLLDTLRG